jgi:hypothetical protein
MGRLIEIQHAPEAPARLTMEVGDLLQFAATGGHVRSGTDVLEMLDPSLPAVVAPHGEIISPLGAPTTVMFVARSPGRATIDVVTGDPWRAIQTTEFDITVRG